MWADGVHFRIRLEEDRLCCLVVIGVRADGTKELLACADGYRESTESWAEVLRDLKTRGMTPPMLAVGDGALGFRAALGEVFPETREQRCWVHKIANILDALPKRLHRRAKAALHEIYQAETRRDADTGIDQFSHLRTTNRSNRPLPPSGPAPGCQRRRQQTPWPCHGLQATRRRPGSMAQSQQPRARRRRQGQRRVQKRNPSREENRPVKGRRLTMPIHRIWRYLCRFVAYLLSQ